jgi:hypothetical protein
MLSIAEGAIRSEVKINVGIFTMKDMKILKKRHCAFALPFIAFMFFMVINHSQKVLLSFDSVTSLLIIPHSGLKSALTVRQLFI